MDSNHRVNWLDRRFRWEKLPFLLQARFIAGLGKDFWLRVFSEDQVRRYRRWRFISSVMSWIELLIAVYFVVLGVRLFSEGVSILAALMVFGVGILLGVISCICSAPAYLRKLSLREIEDLDKSETGLETLKRLSRAQGFLLRGQVEAQKYMDAEAGVELGNSDIKKEWGIR